MDWETPNFAVLEASAEMTAYAGHWIDQEEDGVDQEDEADDDS